MSDERPSRRETRALPLNNFPCSGGPRLMHELLGPDAYCDALASDTPTGRGSVYQCVHGDSGMHDGGEVADLFAINWPLVDVTEENGPFEMAVGGRTHVKPAVETRALVESGQAELQRLTMRVGDVLVRDIRCVHRASPNLTTQPRPMLVMAVVRGQGVRPPRWGKQSAAEYAAMPANQQWLMRMVPRTDGDDVIAAPKGSNGFDLL